MKLCGMILIFLSAVIFSYRKSKRAEERILLIEELCGFMRQARIDISCYLRPVGQIRSDSPRLSSLGFFSDMERYGAKEAYARLEGKVFLSEKEREILRRFFSSLGKGYAEDEIKLIDASLFEISEILKKQKEEAPKQKKLIFTLSSAASLALIILLL